MPQQAENIREAIVALDDVLDWARSARFRIGYFAALYRGMTVQVRDALNDGRFEQPDRLEKLDVVFVNRYLQAVDGFRTGGHVTASWQYAFRTASSWWPIVTQHLLLGCNAHINLDLGVALADVARGEELEPLRSDFDAINGLLAMHVETLQEQLAEVWPWLALLDRLSKADEAIINYAMRAERDHAWHIAERLHPLDDGNRDSEIHKIDGRAAELARLIRHPGLILGTVTKVVRVCELKGVPAIIDILNR